MRRVTKIRGNVQRNPDNHTMSLLDIFERPRRKARERHLPPESLRVKVNFLPSRRRPDIRLQTRHSIAHINLHSFRPTNIDASPLAKCLTPGPQARPQQRPPKLNHDIVAKVRDGRRAAPHSLFTDVQVDLVVGVQVDLRLRHDEGLRAGTAGCGRVD